MMYMTNLNQKKKTVVILGFYLPGIYPAGDEAVISNLLAPAFLKSCADADPEVSSKFDVHILNLPTTLRPEEIYKKIEVFNPYMVAYSVYMWNYDQMKSSSELVKKFLPEAKIILGGPQVTYNSEDMMEVNPQVDIIVCGSGESRFVALLKSDLTPVALGNIPQITFRAENNRVVHTTGTVVEDLAKIPSPYQNGVINLNDGERHTVYIETFRGCPFECGYCIWGDPEKSLHQFPIEQILKDVELIYNNPHVETVYLTDACLFYTRNRASIICDKIASCSRKIPTVATLDILVLNEEMIKDLKKMELIRNQFHFGLQTTNPAALELLKRKSYPEIFTKKIAILRKNIPGAAISFDLIYGLPGDNYEGFRNSLNFAFTLHPGKLYLSPLLLLPGTPFWDDKVQLGFEYENRPPYMAKSNKDYSREDMEKTVDLVLWVLAILYFAPIRDVICKGPLYNSRHTHIELIDKFIEMVRRKIDPVSKINYEWTIESNNEIRRQVMNEIAQPENCLIFYESALKLTRECGLDDLAKDLLAGIDYYRMILSGTIDESDVDASEKYDIDYIKVKWVSA